MECRTRRESGRRLRRWAQLLVVAGLGLAGVAAFAQTPGTFEYTFDNLTHPSAHHSIAPSSIPVGASGTTDIGMALVSFRTVGNGDYTSISSITVQATSDGSFDDSWVSAIRVYFELHDAAVNPGEYDHGAGINDVRADTGGPYTFSGGLATIALDPTVVYFGRPGGAPNYLYVVFDISASAGTSTNLGCEITSITYGLPNVGTGSTSNPTPHGTRKPLDDYTVTAAATGTAPATAAQGAANVGLFRLDLSLADSSATAQLKSVRVRRVAGLDAYLSTGGVLLYEDDGDDVFEPGAGDGSAVATASLSSSSATLTLSPSIAVPGSGKSFFVAVNVHDTNAVIGESFGLEIQNPAADITFEDTILDDDDNDSSVYAWVTFSATQQYAYDQEAYVDPASTAAIPVGTNTFEIVPSDDGIPPSVLATNPTNGASNVDQAATISIVFSEGMTVASVEDEGNFELRNLNLDTAVSFTATYNEAIQTATLTPDADLSWAATYRVTVYSGAGGVLDYYGNGMSSNYTFLFTVRSQYPDVSEPTALNNRIVSGGNSQVVILIPEPPAGDSDRMSVQVFTTTGKLVRTFYRDTAYSTIAASLPLLWDGTNGRGQPLGPGMYFIQIQATNFKRALKVLIVR